MQSTFRQITKVAIEEILENHLTPSKFGHFLNPQGKEELIHELLGFLETSRSLQSAGDKLLKGSSTEKARQGGRKRLDP